MPPDDDAVSSRSPSWGRVLFLVAREGWLETSGYFNETGPANDESRHVFSSSSGRENAWRDDGPGGQVVFDKRVRGLGWGDAVRQWRRTGKWCSPAVWEWHALRRARQAGVRVPAPWSAGEVIRAGCPREGFLVVAQLAGDSLHQLTSGMTPQLATSRDGHDLARAVGRAVAALHAAGILFPSLFAKHVYVDADGSVGFLDLADTRFRAAPSRRERARDLAALAATLSRHPVSRTWRLAALRAYLEAAGAETWSLRAAWRAVEDAMRPFATRRRYRRFLSPLSIPQPRETDPTPGLRLVEDRKPWLDTWGGQDRLMLAAASGWSLTDGGLLFRGADLEAKRHWSTLRNLEVFGVRAPLPVALHARPDATTLITRLAHDPGPPLKTSCPVTAEGPLAAMVLRVLGAGLLPGPGWLPRISVDEDGVLSVPPNAPLEQPRRIRARDLSRGLRHLARDLEELPLTTSSRRKLLQRWTREGPNRWLSSRASRSSGSQGSG